MADITLTEATSPDQLRSFLTEHAPQLLTVLREGTAPTPAPAPAASAPAAAAAAGLTQADIDRALREAREDFTRTLQQREAELRESLRGDIQTADASDRAARVLEGEAHRLIEAATKRAGNPDGFLTPKWAADLKARYSIRANGQVPPASRWSCRSTTRAARPRTCRRTGWRARRIAAWRSRSARRGWRARQPGTPTARTRPRR